MKNLIVVLMLLSGCMYNPVIDSKGLDYHQYNKDLADCRDIVKEANLNSTAEYGTGGAVVGSLVGALISAAFGGDVAHGALYGAASYGTAGAAAGAVSDTNDEQRIIRNCLRGRGYRVLN